MTGNYKLFAVRFDNPKWHPGDDPLEVILLGEYDSWAKAVESEAELMKQGPFALDDRWAFRIISD